MHAPKAIIDNSNNDLNHIAVANNTDFSYPIRFALSSSASISSTVCWPSQMIACIQAYNNNPKKVAPVFKDNARLTSCCEQLYNPSSTPFQTIGNIPSPFFFLPPLLM